MNQAGSPDIVVIVNRGSGSGADEAACDRIAELFAARGRQATIVVAGADAPVDAQARDAVADGARAVVAGGGDGTVNAVAAAAVGRAVAFGVLPLGTLNHFAKDLGLPLELEAAVDVVARGVTRQVDVGEVNGRVFLNNSSLGVYPRIVEMRNRSGATGRAKWIAALWATLAVLRRRPFLAVRIQTPDETVVRRTPFVFVGNNEYRMVGLRAGTREALTGGRLAVYVMNAPRRRSLLLLGWKVMLRGVDRVRELELLTVEEALVETRRVALRVALDGEVMVMETPLRYRILPGALRVLSPA